MVRVLIVDGAQQAGPEDDKDNWSKSLNWYAQLASTET
jgi:hypothetical protein